MAALESEVGALKSEVDALKRAVSSGRHVDLVDFTELRVFMYTDDLCYVQLPEHYKHNQPVPLNRDLSQPRRSPEERYANPSEPLLSTLFSHYWLNGLDFAFVDVGCQYGTSAMAAAQVILSAGQSNHVYAFDPGVAGQLAPFNIELNGLRKQVTFERLAISSVEMPGLVFAELGHSENNRIVNRARPIEAFSYVIQCTSLDYYLAEHRIEQPLVAKIDTQGGEVEVFAGMKRTLASRLVTCITEFVPGAISTRVPADQWLLRLGENFRIFEIRDLDLFLTPTHRVHVVEHDRVREFVREVAQRPIPYTDLLLVPMNLPRAAELADVLTR